jgi:hypothetical protein
VSERLNSDVRREGGRGWAEMDHLLSLRYEQRQGAGCNQHEQLTGREGLFVSTNLPEEGRETQRRRTERE